MDTKASIEQAKQEIARMRDEMKVKLHLAKKDAQEAWKDLEPKITQIERKLDEAASGAGDMAEKARLQATLAMQEVKSQWPGLEKAVGQILADVKKGADDVTGKDTAAELKKAGAKIEKDFEDAAKEIGDTFKGLVNRVFK
jgi:hypothetical protein